MPNTNTDKVFVMLAMFFSGTLQVCIFISLAGFRSWRVIVAWIAMQAAILANVAVAVERLQAKHTQISARIRQVMVALKFHDIPAALTNRVLNSIEYYSSQRYGLQDVDTVQQFSHRCRSQTVCSANEDPLLCCPSAYPCPAAFDCGKLE